MHYTLCTTHHAPYTVLTHHTPHHTHHTPHTTHHTPHPPHHTPHTTHHTPHPTHHTTPHPTHHTPHTTHHTPQVMDDYLALPIQCPGARCSENFRVGRRFEVRENSDSYCTHYTVLILYSLHCTHTVLTTLYSYCTHYTVLILYSYCTHTVLMLYSYCTHTVLTRCARIATPDLSFCSGQCRSST
jgi:hypothetical protein